MARAVAWFLLLSVGLVDVPAKMKPKEPVVVLPTFVVIGTRIPTSWLEVAWECRGPLPIDRIKRAWISQVRPGSPPAKAGVKVGDLLLAIGSYSTDQMTGYSLQMNLDRERPEGSKEEFTLQTPGGEKRTVTIIFEARTPRP